MKSLDELKAIREKMQSQIDLRSENEHASTRIVVGMATCGIAAGARTVLKALSDSIHEKKIENVIVTQTGCIGLCQYEPIVEVIAAGKDQVTYINMDKRKLRRLLNSILSEVKLLMNIQLTQK